MKLYILIDPAQRFFDCARPIYRLCLTCVLSFSTISTFSIFVLNFSNSVLTFSRYILTFSTKIRCILTFSTYVLRISTKDGYVSIFSKFFGMFRFSRPTKKNIFDSARLNFAMFQLFSTYVSAIIDQCFVCARPIFRHSRPKLCMFRLCSTYVLTVLDLFLTVLHLCFACARPMFWLCSTYI